MMIPVTAELLEDAGWNPQRALMHWLELHIRYAMIRDGISRWLEDHYGRPVPYPPQPFDTTRLRPSLPYWPRPHRPLRSNTR